MSSSTSPSSLRFLFDENVDKPKSLSNGELAEFSKSEKRILVTSDDDFVEFTKEKIFSVVWLRIPQREIELLIKSFSRLLEEKAKQEDFEGFLIVLKPSGFESVPLFAEFKPPSK